MFYLFELMTMGRISLQGCDYTKLYINGFKTKIIRAIKHSFKHIYIKNVAQHANMNTDIYLGDEVATYYVNYSLPQAFKTLLRR